MNRLTRGYPPASYPNNSRSDSRLRRSWQTEHSHSIDRSLLNNCSVKNLGQIKRGALFSGLLEVVVQRRVKNAELGAELTKVGVEVRNTDEHSKRVTFDNETYVNGWRKGDALILPVLSNSKQFGFVGLRADILYEFRDKLLVYMLLISPA